MALALSDGVGSERAEAVDSLAAELGGVSSSTHELPPALKMRPNRLIPVRGLHERSLKPGDM